MKGVCNMKSFMKNLLCSVCLFILSVLFNLLILALYIVPYYFLGDLELDLYIDTGTIVQFVIYSIFYILQIISLILIFKSIGKFIATKNKEINIRNVSILLFILTTFFSAIFVYVANNGAGWIGISISNSFFTFSDNLLYLLDGKIFYISLFVLYEIENAIKVLCVYKGYKKYISKRNAEKNH